MVPLVPNWSSLPQERATVRPVLRSTHIPMAGWGFPNPAAATWPPWTPYTNGPYPYLRTGYSQFGQAVPQFFASGNAAQQVDGANQQYRTVGSAAPRTQIQGNAAFQAMGTVAPHTQTQGNAAFPVIGSAAPHVHGTVRSIPEHLYWSCKGCQQMWHLYNMLQQVPV